MAQFDSIASILDYHLNNFMRYIYRMRFTSNQYLRHRLPLDDWRSLRRLIMIFVLNWSVIVTFIGAYNHQSPLFRGIRLAFERTLLVDSQIDIMFAISHLGKALYEFLVLRTQWSLLRYDDSRLEVFYRLRERADREISGPARKRLIATFTRMHGFIVALTRWASIFFTIFAAALSFHAIAAMRRGTIDGAQCTIALAYIFPLVWMMFDTAIAVCTLFPGFLFVIMIFRVKMSRCESLSRWLTISDHATRNNLPQQKMLFTAFAREYIALHKSVTMYNRSMNEYILIIDFFGKFFSTSGVIFMLRQRETNSLLVVCEFMLSLPYVFDHLVHVYLAYFPARNMIVYKWLTRFVGRRTKSAPRFAAIIESRRQNCHEFRFARILDLVSDSRIGFTNGKLYFIDRSSTYEALLLNVYMLVLLWKKIQF